MTKIQLKNINKNFNGVKILNNISFSMEDGEIISLLGPSGCGKSTTLKIIAGLMEPDDGDVILDGTSILKVPAEKRKTVIVFQDHLLFPHLTIGNNIGFGLKMAGIEKLVIEEKVKEIIDLLELQGLEKRYPKELSGGQKQRVALGRALAIEPKILLLDEPFSNLDIRLRDVMRELVLDIQKKLKITTILVTHDKEEALMMSDRIAVMVNGSIAQFDRPENIYEKPINPLVADFLGEKNYIKGFLNNSIFDSEVGRFQLNYSFQGNGKLMVKPEDIKILSKAKSHNNEDIMLQEVHLDNEDNYKLDGIIRKKKYLGDKVHYVVNVGDKELKATSNQQVKLNVDDKVRLSIDFSKGIFYPETIC